MHFSHLALPLAALTCAALCNAQTQYTSTDPAAIAAAQATALTLSPTSAVQGKTFDRFVSIWLENTDYDMAAADRQDPILYIVNCNANKHV